MSNNEQVEPSQPPVESKDEEYADPSGFDEFLYALAEALRGKRSKEAIAALIERYAEQIPIRDRRRYHTMLWSYGFTLLVISGIGLLGWQKIIGPDTASALTGTVIGAIFYRQRGG